MKNQQINIQYHLLIMMAQLFLQRKYHMDKCLLSQLTQQENQHPNMNMFLKAGIVMLYQLQVIKHIQQHILRQLENIQSHL